MTSEEKQLLIKDLCARLLYRPKGVKLNKFGDKDITVTGYSGRFVETIDDEIEVEQVRLYLRPMSSMTEEEKKEYNKTKDKIAVQWDDYGTPIGYVYIYTIKTFDWLNAHHFDYRRLIEKGLALEAPEGMYKTE